MSWGISLRRYVVRMNLNNLTLLLLIAHFLGDFHLQSEELASGKLSSVKSLLQHGFIHLVLLLIVGLLQWRLEIIAVLMIVLATHLFIDFFKRYLHGMSALSTLTPARIYLLDQGMHVLIILLMSQGFFAHLSQPAQFIGWIIDPEWIRWILLLTLITKPANVTFKILFARYQIDMTMTSNQETRPGAGATIGNLERILSAIFLSMNSIASIGLIYTAKSIARFKEIENHQGFAEYYLIGTLFSILFVIAAYLLIFG